MAQIILRTRSSNAVVNAAIRAQNSTPDRGVRGMADVLVEFTALDGNGLSKVQRRMSPSYLEAWLKKTGNSAHAADIWLSLARSGRALFSHPATEVKITAL